MYLNEKKFSDHSVSLKEKMWLWRHGFSSGQKIMLNLNRDNIHNFLNNYDHKSHHPYNGIFSRLIDSKPFLPLIIPKKYTCDLYVVFEKGKLTYTNSGNIQECKANLKEYVKTNALVAKPFNKSGGTGFQVIHADNINEQLNYISEKKLSVQINERIGNQPYSQKIFPDATNTIRMILMRNQITSQIFIVAANHRFGTSESIPVDNTDRGGIFSVINLETGVMGNVRLYDMQNLKSSTCHPDTHSGISGSKVPGWDHIKKTILELFNSITWLDYCGLDLVLTESGFKILEINSLPACIAPQIDNPYLAIPEIRNFFLAKGHIPVNKK